ncbi:hypothetical protein PCANB_000042 [Pneumocystis canis]|nr:hypothetical protein PCK1_000144 [Pneumocystis canis]KAG5439760.1 hypothetical protein PCANB_000042 [Pneumocystis canis]
MDKTLETDNLTEARNLLYLGCYTQLLEKELCLKDNNEMDQLMIRILKGRAQCMTGKANELLWELKDTTIPALIALRGWVRNMEGDSDGIHEINVSLQEAPNDTCVKILSSMVLFRIGRCDEAQELLYEHTDIEAVALAVQMFLSKASLDAALKVVGIAKTWARDDFVLQLAEAWIDMSRGGSHVLNAFYIYEELAQTALNPTVPTMLIGQAVTELLIGRASDAIETLQTALSLAPNDSDALANSIVAATLLGNDTSTYSELLTLHHPSHPWVTSMSYQSSLFDQLSKTFLIEDQTLA